MKEKKSVLRESEDIEDERGEGGGWRELLPPTLKHVSRRIPDYTHQSVQITGRHFYKHRQLIFFFFFFFFKSKVNSYLI